MKGRIVEITFETQNVVYLTQGVKRKDQFKYEGRFPGGNGTYVTGGEYNSYIILKLYAYDLERCVCVDIKESVLSLNKRKRISNQMIETLVRNNVGKKVKFHLDDTGIHFPAGELDLMV